MKLLLNDCYRSDINVYPKNWKTLKASLKKKWYIWYRFHDPAFKHLYKGKGKKIQISGMNDFHTLAERQAITLRLLKDEYNLVDVRNYNHFTSQYMSVQQPKLNNPNSNHRPITSSTPLINVLDWAYENVKVSKSTMENLKSVLTYTWQVADLTGLSSKKIIEVEKSDMRIILDKVGELKGDKWTNNTFNYYRAHLGILFSHMDEYDVFRVNPMLGIKKRPAERKIREVLDEAAFRKISDSVKVVDYYFWRFIHIFHRSGGRRPEILGVQDIDVDLPGRRYKVLINKGKRRWEWKDIEDDVLYLWQDIVQEAARLKKLNGFPLYLFSINLRPHYRSVPIRPEQVTRRWRKRVKVKLGITADLYSLKHFNTTTEISEAVDAAIERAQTRMAKKNSHTTTKMVKTVYDVKSQDRERLLKKRIKLSLQKIQKN